MKSYKGCCLMCATGKGKVKCEGRPNRDPVSVKRLLGKTKRFSRHEIPKD